MKRLLALSGLALAASSASAFEQPYLGLSYVPVSYEEADGSDASPAIGQLRFGTDLTKHLGLQARLSFGVDDDVIAKPGNEYDLTIENIYSLGIVGRLPFGDHGSLYGHVSYSYLQISAESAGAPVFPSTEGNDDTMSYGVGFVFPAWKHYNLELDYTSYVDKDSYTLEGFGIGLRRYL